MSTSFTLLFAALGVGLPGLVAYDVYATILHPRARAGPIGERLNRGVWWLARGLAFRFLRPRCHLNVAAREPSSS